MPVSLSQYRGTIGMFDNIFANKRCIGPRICYRRKMQSCEFGSIIILPILLQAFSILIGFLKKIAWQNMLMVQINKKYQISCFYLFLPCSYLYHIWLFPRLIRLSGDIEKNPIPKKNFCLMFSIGHWNLNSLVAQNLTIQDCSCSQCKRQVLHWKRYFKWSLDDYMRSFFAFKRHRL